VVQTADAGRLDGAFRRSILAEREVRPRPLVVRDVGKKDPTKMPLIEDDEVVQTLAADRADDVRRRDSARASEVPCGRP
jgi:hypothetical protein